MDPEWDATKFLACSTKVPHATWTSVDIGGMSVLFSFGHPVGLGLGKVTYVRGAIKRASQKHLNNWRDFRQQVEITPDEFDSRLVDSLEREVKRLREQLTKRLENDTMADQENELDSQLNSLNDPAQQEVNDLDEELEEEDDDSPYEDDDDDDDFDDEDEDGEDEDLDDDDLDEEFEDAEGEDGDEDLKENEF